MHCNSVYTVCNILHEGERQSVIIHVLLKIIICDVRGLCVNNLLIIILFVKFTSMAYINKRANSHHDLRKFSKKLLQNSCAKARAVPQFPHHRICLLLDCFAGECHGRFANAEGIKIKL